MRTTMYNSSHIVLKLLLVANLSFFVTFLLVAWTYTSDSCRGSIEVFHIFNQKRNNNTTSYSVNFIETSPSLMYNSRQFCAFESAARLNPDLIINVYFKYAKNTTEAENLTEQYRNIKFIQENFTDVFEDTPLNDWYENAAYQKGKGKNEINHLSDAARYAIIYKNGGVYLDTDQFTLKSFNSLFPSDNSTPHAVFAKEHPGSMGAAAFFATKGHKFLLDAMMYLKKTYNPDDFGVAGPVLLTKLVKQNNCDLYENCNVSILNPGESFYPIFYNDVGTLFETKASTLINVQYKINYAYTLHLWNRFTEGTVMSQQSGTCALDLIMARICPYTHKRGIQ